MVYNPFCTCFGVSFAVINYHGKKHRGEERIIWLILHLMVHRGKLEQELRAGTEAEDRGGLPPGCFPMACLVCFLYNLGPPV